MNQQHANQLIEDLYQAVDNKNLDYLNEVLSDDVNFRISNYDTISNKAAALEANRQFFDGIESMSHTIDKVWSAGSDVLCNGVVDYVRLDGSDHSAYFSTVLTIDEGKIADYFVYADISGL